MSKNKIFQSKSLNTVRALDRAVWLIPLCVLIFDIIRGGEIVDAIRAKPSAPVLIMFLLMLVFMVAFQSLVPFAVLKVILHNIKKQLLKNSRFVTVEDFDYYRDKLTGLSPGIISILADLNIERKKDAAASILKYQEMGVLKFENGQYFVTEKYQNAPLRESDRYMINGLVNQSFYAETDSQWVKLIEKEAFEEGFITNQSDPVQMKKNSRRMSLGCLGGCLTPVILFVLAVVIIFSIDLDHMDSVIDSITDSATVAQQIEIVEQDPEFRNIVIIALFGIMFFFIALISPALMLAGFIASAFNVKLYRRTDKGNQMTECIFGMKNFIHDFSNLSEATQEHIVLWDDYLVYAVVLEENQQIIDEIMKRRREKWDRQQ